MQSQHYSGAVSLNNINNVSTGKPDGFKQKVEHCIETRKMEIQLNKTLMDSINLLGSQYDKLFVKFKELEDRYLHFEEDTLIEMEHSRNDLNGYVKQSQLDDLMMDINMLLEDRNQDTPRGNRLLTLENNMNALNDKIKSIEGCLQKDAQKEKLKILKPMNKISP